MRAYKPLILVRNRPAVPATIREAATFLYLELAMRSVVLQGLMSLVSCVILYVTPCPAQVPTAPTAPSGQPAPPPATKLEAFMPAAGAVVVMGYTVTGHVERVTVQARELRVTNGGVARGMVVEVTQSQYREERSFVDADEIPELLKGIDALLAVTANPTSFKNFEVRYRTRGGLEITAFNSSSGDIQYAVQTGRITTAQSFLSQAELRSLRGMFVAAQQLVTPH